MMSFFCPLCLPTYLPTCLPVRTSCIRRVCVLLLLLVVVIVIMIIMIIRVPNVVEPLDVI